MVGRTLTHYRILEKIGAGGMGEVYRALDTKLGREVAVKVLPESMAQHPERIARLRREAQILATLNHPNIAAVYDLDECEGTYFLVQELVPGNTLAGPVPVREALSLCGQIAAGLEAAHQKGITHRDLKPANVKITPDGRVKLLDFGLARVGGNSGESGIGDATMTAEATREGVILGTAAYMSPEQARGRPLDKQSDIWSFGCVLYETLTGRQVFTGGTFADIIAAILREDPKLEDLPATTPPNVRRLLERCLRQDLGQRLKDIGDARLELEEAPPAPAVIAEPVQSRSRGLVWILGGLLLAAAAFGGWWWGARPRQAATTAVHFQRITDFVGMEEFPAISPDGKTVAFVSYVEGRRQIWIRLLSGGVPLQITKDDSDHEHPRWAPDSSSLIYYSPAATPGEQGTIWAISALGGSPRRVASASGGGDISHDGRRLAFLQSRAGRTDLVTAALDGSDVRTLKQLQAESFYQYPRWSPDDRWIAFERSIMDTFDDGVWVISSSGGEPRQVSPNQFLKKGISWLPDGSGLVYASSAGSQIPYPPTFQLSVIGIEGGPERQLTFGDVSYLQPDLHPSGRMVASRVRTQSDIWRFPVSGSPLENTRGAVRITQQTGQAQTPSASPDGKELVYLSDSGGHGNLWVAKTDGSGARQITFESQLDTLVGVPAWSPRENLISFVITRSGKAGQWLIRSDGSGLRQLLERGVWSYWSGDGRWLYYTVVREGRFCIEKTPLDGEAPVVVRCDNALVPSVTPDGSALYYVSLMRQEGGAFDWEIRKASPENGPPQVLGRIPGSRIPNDFLNMQLIVSPDGRSLAVPLADGATSNLWVLPAGGGELRRVTDFGGRSVIITRRISWSPDGKYLYAAVAETDADVVLLEGLVGGK